MNADHAHDQSRGKTPRASESIVEVRSRVVHVGRTSLSVLAEMHDLAQRRRESLLTEKR